MNLSTNILSTLSSLVNGIFVHRMLLTSYYIGEVVL
jgi:hypothetical protein